MQEEKNKQLAAEGRVVVLGFIEDVKLVSEKLATVH